MSEIYSAPVNMIKRDECITAYLEVHKTADWKRS